MSEAVARTRVAVDVSEETLWRSGVAVVTAAVGLFFVFRLTAWPPHEDETLALFTGRSSFGTLLRTVIGERGGAPLHFLFAWLVAHTGGGLLGLRVVSAVFATASVPPIALLARRLTDRWTALVTVAIVAPSWILLFHGVYARMYSLFLFTATLSYLAFVRAVRRGDRRSWALWAVAILLCIAAHQYGALVLGSQGLYVLYARRFRNALPWFVAVFVLAIPFWKSDTVLANRFDVGVGGNGVKLGGPLAILQYFVGVAGDMTVGWWWARLVVLLVAGAGLVLLARRLRDSAVLVACVIATPFLFFLVTRVGSTMTSPESRHLIFALPFFALLVAGPVVELARRWPVALALVAVLGAGEVLWGLQKTRPLYVGEPTARVQAREAASAWLAEDASPNDILFGYDPLFLGAWERNGRFSDTVVPRADTALALHILYRAHKPLGRGIWVLDASDTNNNAPKLTIPLRYPEPQSRFDVRTFGPFLVVRTRQPTRTIRQYLLDTQAVQFVGQSLYLGDSDINLLTVENALGLRGLDAGPQR